MCLWRCFQRLEPAPGNASWKTFRPIIIKTNISLINVPEQTKEALPVRLQEVSKIGGGGCIVIHVLQCEQGRNMKIEMCLSY